MKRAIILATAALALAGCQPSIDQQFRSMCKAQEAKDPETWAMSEGACRQAEHLTDAEKKSLIDAYADVQRARTAAGQ